jgi:hypothetical protein
VNNNALQMTPALLNAIFHPLFEVVKNSAQHLSIDQLHFSMNGILQLS